MHTRTKTAAIVLGLAALLGVGVVMSQQASADAYLCRYNIPINGGRYGTVNICVDWKQIDSTHAIPTRVVVHNNSGGTTLDMTYSTFERHHADGSYSIITGCELNGRVSPGGTVSWDWCWNTSGYDSSNTNDYLYTNNKLGFAGHGYEQWQSAKLN